METPFILRELPVYCHCKVSTGVLSINTSTTLPSLKVLHPTCLYMLKHFQMAPAVTIYTHISIQPARTPFVKKKKLKTWGPMHIPMYVFAYFRH